jgi:MerR family transcriptional regulator/heat shock protein HspR
MWPGDAHDSPDSPDQQSATYVISVVASLTGLHPQTLRQYDRLEIVSPDRASGGGRRYSQQHLDQLHRVQELTAEGVNLEGVRRILALEQQVRELLQQLGHSPTSAWPTGEEQAHPYLPVPYTTTGTALVVWRRRHGAR